MESKQTSVLLVEDNPGDARLIQAMLADSGNGDFLVQEASRLSTGLERLASQDFDVLLLDLSLPDSQGLETLSKAVACGRKLPIIVLTGLEDEDTAVRALREGAQDYLLKGQTDASLLTRCMRYAAERFRLRNALELSHEKQLKMRDELLSHVSHELRTPLTAFHQFTDLLLDEIAGPINAEQKQYLVLALNSAKQLGKMIDQILTVSRAESGKLPLSPRPVSMSELIAGAMSIVRRAAAEKQVTLTADIEDSLPAVSADPDRIRQVLLNLIENGVKYTRAGGQVRATARISETESDSIEVAISDDGYGIETSHLNAVFERFYQAPGPVETSRKGLGLGLYIAKELVAAHGGRMWLQSTVGAGTTFFFSIPVFSFKSLLSSVLTSENLKNRLPVFFTIRIFQQPGKPAGDEALGWAREVLERSVRPVSDLVLPHYPPGEPLRALYIVACTDLKGAGLMAQRIYSALQAENRLVRGGWKPEVNYIVAQAPLQPDGHIAAAVNEVEQIILNHTTRHVAHA
jgi:signal transduction histidine kinase